MSVEPIRPRSGEYPKRAVSGSSTTATRSSTTGCPAQDARNRYATAGSILGGEWPVPWRRGLGYRARRPSSRYGDEPKAFS
jgi:hypothetical protein